MQALMQSTRSSYHSIIDSNNKEEHLGSHRQYWRDIILGVNDGLVSTFLLVMGVCGGGLSTRDILLTAISGALAGAISMCAGEFIATKSQNEVLSGEINLEKKHIASFHAEEIQELNSLLKMIGITEEESQLRESLINFYDSQPGALLKIMTVLEFGVVSEEIRSPWTAGATSCILFLLGSAPSVIPFAISDSPSWALTVAGIATLCALMVVGAIKTWATRGNFASAAIENLVIAGLGGAIAYGVGTVFDHYMGIDVD